MQLIPAIDLKDGQCVRLQQGRMADATVFSDDPVAMAEHWRDQGAERLHVVDLDGAFAGAPRNADLVHRITRAIAPVPVQIGGGVRDMATVDAYLDAGVSQVILGTRAVEDPAFLERAAAERPGAIILGLDARNGKLALEGWDDLAEVTAGAFARRVRNLPLFAIVYTDIERDGMLTGVNAEATRALADAADVPVIASGGIAGVDDLHRLTECFRDAPQKLLGAITGRAIYAGTLDFAEGRSTLAAAARARR